MKLGIRLKAIAGMLNKRYSEIWDCCCDHGLLGFQLLQQDAAKQVHFVDIVPELVAEVDAYLADNVPQSETNRRWQTHCLDVRSIPLSDKPNQLIIIAGVGGDLMIEFIEALVEKHRQLPLEFLLCPVHHNLKVRKCLAELNLGLLNEQIVSENKRFYELLHVSTESDTQLSPTGSSMWHKDDPVHKAYLRSTINHYQRMHYSRNEDIKKEAAYALQAYAPLKALFKLS